MICPIREGVHTGVVGPRLYAKCGALMGYSQDGLGEGNFAKNKDMHKRR